MKKQKPNNKKIFCLLILSAVLFFVVFYIPVLSKFIAADLFFGTNQIQLKNPSTGDLPLHSAGEASIDYCDVLVAGGGVSGFAAGVQAARMGIDTCIVEDANWLGGMMTSAGVSAFDGAYGDAFSGGIFGEVRNRIEEWYQRDIKSTQKCSVSYLCFEPSVGVKILNDIAQSLPNLSIIYNSEIEEVYKNGNKVTGARIKNKNGDQFIIPAKVIIDATEFGDVLELAGADYVLGIDKNSSEPHINTIEQCIQPLTYVMIVKNYGRNMTIEKPNGYNRDNYKCSVKNALCNRAAFSFNDFIKYGQLPNGKIMINWPFHRWGNDFDATDAALNSLDRKEILQKAKEYSLGFLYFIQTQAGYNTYGLVNEFDTIDDLPLEPYVRESRRLKGVTRLTENDILAVEEGKRSTILKDTIAIGDYPIDLHYCETRKDFYEHIQPYQIPYGVLVPEKIDGLLAAEKNISVSHIVNGTTRLQPVVMAVGQAAGAAAALSIKEKVELRNLDIEKLQNILLEAGSILYFYKDILPTDLAFKEINNLSLKGIFKGFDGLIFNPSGPMTRSEILKIAYVARDPVTQRSVILEPILMRFVDLEKNIQPEYIKKAISNRVLEGYSDANGNLSIELNKLVTRAEAIKIFLKANGYEAINTSASSFLDVEGWSTGWIEKAYALGLVRGANHYYFEPDRYISRSEAALILSRLIKLKEESSSVENIFNSLIN